MQSVCRSALVLLLVFVASGSAGVEGRGEGSGAATVPTVRTWTAIIPDAYPGNIYTWRLKEGGTYEEEGRRGATGATVQATLVGRWSADGPAMTLRQDGLPFVFIGSVTGERYSGMLTLHGRSVSRFCAREGDTPPESCDSFAISTLRMPQQDER